MGNTLDMQQTLVSPTHAFLLSLCEQSVQILPFVYMIPTPHIVFIFFNRRFSKLESALPPRGEMHLFEINGTVML